MKNTIKLLTLAVACTLTTPSFGMFMRMAERIKFKADRSWQQLKFDIRYPKQIALKSCAGIGAGDVFGGFCAAGLVSFDASFTESLKNKNRADIMDKWKKIREKMVYPVSLAPYAAAGLIAGPIGLISYSVASGFVASQKAH